MNKLYEYGNKYFRFEIMIGDWAEYEGIETKEELQDFSGKLHTAIEQALEDYAKDNYIEGYAGTR